jgi:hypothetical protein
MMPSFSHSPAIRWPRRMCGYEAMIEEVRFAEDSPLEGAGFEPSVPRESNGEKAKEPVSLVERKVPEMSSTGRRLSIFTSGFSRD